MTPGGTKETNIRPEGVGSTGPGLPFLEHRKTPRRIAANDNAPDWRSVSNRFLFRPVRRILDAMVQIVTTAIWMIRGSF